MTDSKDDKTLSVTGKKTLTLKPTGVNQGTVRQDMGRGRTKAVVVETRKRRPTRPEDERAGQPQGRVGDDAPATTAAAAPVQTPAPVQAPAPVAAAPQAPRQAVPPQRVQQTNQYSQQRHLASRTVRRRRASRAASPTGRVARYCTICPPAKWMLAAALWQKPRSAKSKTRSVAPRKKFAVRLKRSSVSVLPLWKPFARPKRTRPARLKPRMRLSLSQSQSRLSLKPRVLPSLLPVRRHLLVPDRLPVRLLRALCAVASLKAKTMKIAVQPVAVRCAARSCVPSLPRS